MRWTGANEAYAGIVFRCSWLWFSLKTTTVQRTFDWKASGMKLLTVSNWPSSSNPNNLSEPLHQRTNGYWQTRKLRPKIYWQFKTSHRQASAFRQTESSFWASLERLLWQIAGALEHVAYPCISMILRRSCWQAEPTIEFHPRKIRDTSINEIRITLRKSIAFTYCSTLSPTLRDPISQIQTPPEMESEQQAMVPRFQLIKGLAIWSTVWHLGETWRKHNSGALHWNDPGCKIHRKLSFTMMIPLVDSLHTAQIDKNHLAGRWDNWWTQWSLYT